MILFTTLVPGDHVLYQGSITEAHGFYEVTDVTPVPALFLAALAEGRDPRDIPEAHRYTLTNGRGEVLDNVRRESIFPLDD